MCIRDRYNVGQPFERIAIDIAGPFPVTDDGNRYITVSYTHLEQSTRLSNAPERSRRKRVVYVLLKACCENFLDYASLRSVARTVSRPCNYVIHER